MEEQNGCSATNSKILKETRHPEINRVVFREKLLTKYDFDRQTKTCIHSAAIVLYFTDIIWVVFLLSFVIDKVSGKL